MRWRPWARPRPNRRISGGGNINPACYFLARAAEQGEADAMYWLGLLHAAGLGQAGDADGDALAVMWLAKAAAHGHAIATQQLAALLPGQVPGF
ncbi:hypothetical protein MASR1M59_13650 [Melaminivora sp.]